LAVAVASDVALGGGGVVAVLAVEVAVALGVLVLVEVDVLVALGAAEDVLVGLEPDLVLFPQIFLLGLGVRVEFFKGPFNRRDQTV